MFGDVSRSRSRRRQGRKRLIAGATASGCLALAVAGCGGSGASSAGAGSGKVGKPSASVSGTLVQWNTYTENQDPGMHEMMPLLIRLFKQKYPDVKVTNLEMSLPEQQNKLPLDLSTASSAPDVTATNEGFQSLGRLVSDRELTPLTKYMKLYGWAHEVGKLALQYNSFTSDGKSQGQGSVYSVPWDATPLGIYYNKKLLARAGAKAPTSWATFEQDLALVKKAGITPMAYGGGQPTIYQPLHVFYELADAYAPAHTSINFVFHTGKDPSIDVPGYVKAAQTLQQWSKAGYFQSGYTGVSGAQALSTFTSGKSAFFIEGDWYISAVQKGLGNNAGFWMPPTTTGGPDEGFSIPRTSTDPNTAAAFINMGLSPKFQTAMLKYGQIPLISLSHKVLDKAPTMLRAAAEGWDSSVSKNTLVPYLDYATPNLVNQLVAAVQELQAGKITPTAMIQQLQSDYTDYWSSK